MKKALKKFLALSGLSLLMLSACKKDGTLVTSNGGKPGALTASTSTLVLSKANNGDAVTAAITFNFTQPSYGFNAAVTNTLQIDAPGDNWANPTSATLGVNTLTQSYSTPAFNAMLLKMKLVGGVTSTVNVRVAQSISAGIAPVYSNIVALAVTPYNLSSWVYLVGNFNGYSTSAPDSLYSPTSNGIYTGIINVTTGNTRFLVLPARNFNNKYATVTNPGATGTTLTYATEYVTGGGNDLYTPSTPGFYFISLNTNTNSITIAPANTYSAIGTVVGDAGGFSIDAPLTNFINDGNTGWQGVVAFNVGSFKIRQNNDWTYSWGIPKAGSDGAGVANTLNDTSNDNIPITVAKSYTVSFNIAASAMGTSAGNSTPAVTTATYKLQ
jgi:hypothetical protein